MMFMIMIILMMTNTGTTTTTTSITTTTTTTTTTTSFVFGGWSDSGYAATEVLGTPTCTGVIPPVRRHSHLTVSSDDGELLLVCGGNYNFNLDSSCDKFDLQTKTFKHHSDMLQKRYWSSAVYTSEGVLVVGGFHSKNTIDFLPKHSTNWVARNDIPGNGVYYSCMVMVSESVAMVVGGVYSRTAVRLYDVTTDQWTDLPSLSVGVYNVMTVSIQRKVC